MLESAHILFGFALCSYGKGLVQHVWGRGTEAVFAFFVEIHRCGINGDKGGSQLHLAGSGRNIRRRPLRR